jgi:hypothetical protein
VAQSVLVDLHSHLPVTRKNIGCTGSHWQFQKLKQSPQIIAYLKAVNLLINVVGWAKPS